MISSRKRALTFRINIKSIFEYLLAAMLLLECRSVFYHDVNVSSWFSYVVLFLLGLSCCFLCYRNAYRVIAIRWEICFVVLITLYFSIYILIRPENILSLFKIILALILIGSVAVFDKNGKLMLDTMHKYRNIVLFLAIVSLMFWVFGFVCGLIQPNTSITYTWGGTKTVKMYFYLAGSAQTQTMSFLGIYKMARNTSIFTEAPMASIIFSIAYIYEMYLNKNKKIFAEIVLAVAIVSTLSTTGFVVIIMSLLLKLFYAKPNTLSGRLLKWIIMAALIFICGVIIYILLKQKMTERSGSIRLSYIIEGTRVWLKEMLFGYGYNSDNLELEGGSNSIVKILTYGGIYFLIPYFYAIAKGLYLSLKIRSKNITAFILIFVWNFVLTVIPFQYLSIFLFVFISSVHKNYLPERITYKSMCPAKYDNPLIVEEAYHG